MTISLAFESGIEPHTPPLSLRTFAANQKYCIW